MTTYDDIIRCISESPANMVTYQKIASDVGISNRLAYSLCMNLVKEGKLVKDGTTNYVAFGLRKDGENGRD